MRINAEGKQIGKVEYHTPQSQQMVDAMGDSMMTVNVPQAMQVGVQENVSCSKDALWHRQPCLASAGHPPHVKTQAYAVPAHIDAHPDPLCRLLGCGNLHTRIYLADRVYV